MQHLRRDNITLPDPDLDREYYRVDPYDLIGFLLETLSYGIFLVLFLLSTALIVRQRNTLLREKAIEPVKLRSLTFYLVTGILMFLATTGNWSFRWAEVLPIPKNTRTGAVVEQLPRLSRTAYRLKQVFLKLAVMLGDVVTIYRLWVLSNGSKAFIAIPVLSFFGFIASAIALVGPGNSSKQTLVPIQNGKLVASPWDISATVCTIGVTVSVSLLIAGIILRARSRVGKTVLGNGLNRILVIIVESASIYTIWNLFFFIASLGFQSEVALAFLDCMPAVYGICVMLINVRVGLGWALSVNMSEHPRTSNYVSGRGNALESQISSSYSRGVYISTMVFTDAEQPRTADIELRDTRDVSPSASGKLPGKGVDD